MATSWIGKNGYLSNRKQRVRLWNIKSFEISVASGVPQNFILGPVSFSISTSSHHPKDSKVHLVKCAHNAMFVVPVFKTDTSDLQALILKVAHFKKGYSVHSMETNVKKTKVTNVCFSRIPLPPMPLFENFLH